MTIFSSQSHSSTLVRLVAILLVASTVFFALTVWMEKTSESSELPAVSENLEGGEDAGTPNEASETYKENEQTEGSHTELSESAENGEQAETVIGINLENSWLVWGFVLVSLILSAGVFYFGRAALLLVVLLAGVAAFLDSREVISQFGRANMSLAGMAAATAFLHASASILALVALRKTGTTYKGVAASEKQPTFN